MRVVLNPLVKIQGKKGVIVNEGIYQLLIALILLAAGGFSIVLGICFMVSALFGIQIIKF